MLALACARARSIAGERRGTDAVHFGHRVMAHRDPIDILVLGQRVGVRSFE